MTAPAPEPVGVHPHSSVEWSPECLACPAERPEGLVEVDLDDEVVERMTREATDALPGARTAVLTSGQQVAE